jgi:hypothetical protein
MVIEHSSLGAPFATFFPGAGGSELQNRVQI